MSSGSIKTGDDVLREMHDLTIYAPTENTSEAFVISPDTEDPDETRTIVMALPHLHGLVRHMYIRAKVMQQIVAPNCRLVGLPNNSLRHQSYDLSSFYLDDRAERTRNGSMIPFGEQQMRTLEGINRSTPLGAVGLSGYSSGAGISLAMAAVGSSELEVVRVNADEAPSKPGRNWINVVLDNLQSASGQDYKDAVAAAGIPALTEAMASKQAGQNMAKFFLKHFSRDGFLMLQAMTNSVDITASLISADIPTKIGYVINSKLFDPALPGSAYGSSKIVGYEGEGFRGHATADDVFMHALMANHGLN